MDVPNDIDNKILNLMLLNPHLSYVEGYTNIYCEKNKNVQNEDNNINNYVVLSNQLNNNLNKETASLINDNMKFVNMNNMIPFIYNQDVEINMNVGGGSPAPNNEKDINRDNFNVINNNNFQSNFSIYINGEKKNSSEGIPIQFKDINYQDNIENSLNNNINHNNNTNNNIVNNQENNNVNFNNINSGEININNNSIINNPNNNVKEDSKSNSDVPPSNNISGTNVKNPIYNLLNTNNEEVNNSLMNSEEEKNDFNLQVKYMKEAYNSLVKSNENNINQNIEGNDDKITIIFILKENQERFTLRVNPDQKFSEVLSEFSQKHNNIIQKTPIAIHNYDMVEKEKTLRENNIKNDDEILLINISDKKNKSNIEDDDREIYHFFLREYKAKKFGEYLIQLKKDIKEKKEIKKFELKVNTEELIKFLLVRSKIKQTGISIREHKHNVVCCITNYSWNCNQCGKNYNGDDEKFCCSLCDYNMCQECRKLKNYERRKTIKKDITPDNSKYRSKYLDDEKLHEHKLIYCITSRFYFGPTFWKCDLCKKKGNNWAFYCTICDFDLCVDCYLKNKSK